MKKYLIKIFVATLFMLSQTKSWGQIVLDSTDLPVIGDIEIYKKLDSTQSSTVLPGPSGANQVWNFSSLPTNPLDTNFYVAPSATPNGSSFPNANIAIKYFNVLQYNYDYCINGPGGMKINGFVFGNPANIIVLDIEPFKFPILTFGNSINHNLRARFNIVNSNTYDVLFISFTSTADAWGTITTPAGTVNAIRIHTTETSYDSSYVNGVGTQNGTGTGFNYQWYAKGLGWPVLQIAKGKLVEPDYQTVQYVNTLNGAGGSSSQNVGIGTTTPTEKLDVYGNINVSGAIKAVGLDINGNINVTQTIKANSVAGTSGQVLGTNPSGNLAWLNVPVGGFSNFQVFNSSGTFTVPVGITRVMVEVWGAGGAGSGTPSGGTGGCGGGGGGYGKGIFTVLPAAQFPVTIGTGGTGVVSGSGNAGTGSSFDILISASGGSGGQFGGGVSFGGGSSGAFSVAGGGGGPGGNNSPNGFGGSAGGGGGSGHPGGGGQGIAPGGGGSGTGVPGTAGGNGALGRVVVWW